MASNGAVNGASPLDKDAKNSRAAVHTFNPDASPEEKAAATGKAKDKLKPVNEAEQPVERGAYSCNPVVLEHATLRITPTEVQIDNGSGGVVPTITLTDADHPDAESPSPEADGNAPPGGMPTATSPIPDWYTIGWRQTARIDEPELPEGEERDMTALAMFVSEQYYGAWYHNAAIIVFVSGVSPHAMTRAISHFHSRLCSPLISSPALDLVGVGYLSYWPSATPTTVHPWRALDAILAMISNANWSKPAWPRSTRPRIGSTTSWIASGLFTSPSSLRLS